MQAEFLLASRENKWPRRVEMSSDEYVMMHNANVMVQFTPNNESENWSGEDIGARPKVVRRGIADIEDEIDDGKLESVNSAAPARSTMGKKIIVVTQLC